MKTTRVLALACASMALACAGSRPTTAVVSTAPSAAPSAIAAAPPARPAATAPVGPLEQTAATTLVSLARIAPAGVEGRAAPGAVLAFGIVPIEANAEAFEREGRLDPARPMVTYRGPLDGAAAQYLARVHEAAGEIPAAEGLDAFAAGERGQAIEALLSSCAPGGFSYRVVLPSLDGAATVAYVTARLGRRRWESASVPGASEPYLRSRSGDTLVRATSDARHAVLDVWVEPLYACQSERDRAGFLSRAAERIDRETSATSAPEGTNAPDPSLVVSAESDEAEQGRFGLALGLHAVFDAVGWRREGGPSIEPSRLRALVLMGVREADGSMRLALPGVSRSRYTVTGEGPSRRVTVVSTVAARPTPTSPPPADRWAPGPSIAPTGAADVLARRDDFTRSLGQRMPPAEHFALRREAGWGGMTVGLLSAFSAAVSKTFDDAWPAQMPVVQGTQTPVESRSVVRLASDPQHPVSLVVLQASATNEQAACALSPEGSCPAAARLTGAPRAIAGGFARVVTVGTRRVVAASAARAPLAALRLGPVAAAPPVAGGTLAPESHAPLTWGFITGPATFTLGRAGDDVTLELRPL